MFQHVRLLATMFLVAASVPSVAAPALQPIGPWVLDYADTDCVASRKYGQGEAPIIFGIRPAPNGETYELLLATAGRPPAYAGEFDGSVDFGSGPVSAWVLRGGNEHKDKVIYAYRISASAMAQARSAKLVKLHARSIDDVMLTLSNIPALLDGLQKCTADLMRYWNMGGEKDGRIARPAQGDIRRIFNSYDFPQEAMNRAQEGSGQFMLLVDEKGAIANCEIVKTSGIPVFDARACQVIRERARFKPAQDANGKPVRSAVITPPIVWKL